MRNISRWRLPSNISGRPVHCDAGPPPHNHRGHARRGGGRPDV